jgi:hypothetical protein
VKCPECVEAGLESKVYSNGSTNTLLGWRPYYDEQGTYHIHDPNRTIDGWYCSNKHYWGEVRKKSCPNCDWTNQ